MAIFPVADPYVLRAEGRYWLYAAGAEKGTFTVRVSDDLTHWGPAKEIFRAGADSWSLDCYWAPECHVIDGRYCLFYSANQRHNPAGEAETFRIAVAVCDTPDGAFRDLLGRPIFDPGYPIIDGNILQEDGRIYLYYSRCCYKHRVGQWEESWIYGVELKRDLSGIIGEPRLLLRPEQPWEGRSAPTTGRRWNEGSFICRRDGRYYMLYSANYFLEPHYAMGYAVASAPLGPWVKAAENPVVTGTEAVSGTGHGCLVETPDGLAAVYHGRTAETGSARVGFWAPASIEGGRLRVAYDRCQAMRD